MQYHCLLAVCVVLFGGSACSHAAAPPNIVFVLADDAGLGDFGCYGSQHVKTPNIDRLAAGGMKFTNAYSGSAVCAPTRCVLMTGLDTGGCRRRDNEATGARESFSGRPLVFLEPEDVTVAELLREQGYATGGFGKWGLGNPGSNGVPEKQGFDTWFGYYDQVHAHDYFTDHLIRNSAPVPLSGNTGGQQSQYSAGVIHEAAMEFLEARAGKGSFFLYLAYTLPHGKYVIPDNAPYGDRPWPPEVRNYAAMLSLLDRQVGDVLARLEKLGMAKNTLVLFSSDNGANPIFAETIGSTAGLRGRKSELYEGGIRAPLIAYWPGTVAPGSSSDLLTSHVDFLATAAALAGINKLPATGGVSLLPTLLGRGQQPQHEWLYWEIHHPFQQAVRMGPWKGYRRGTAEPVELYDLSKDPAEARDVSAENPQVVARITALLATARTETPFYPAVTKAKSPGRGKAARRGGVQR